jgi:hypothetical protein
MRWALLLFLPTAAAGDYTSSDVMFAGGFFFLLIVIAVAAVMAYPAPPPENCHSVIKHVIVFPQPCRDPPHYREPARGCEPRRMPPWDEI